MRQPQRRDSARDWIRTGATVTVTSYAKRYGVDRYTAYDDLAVLGLTLPAPARRWAQRPPATTRRTVHGGEQPDDSWIMLDGSRFFAAGYTPGGAPYGIFPGQIPRDDPL